MYDPVRDALMSNTTAAAEEEEEKQRRGGEPTVLSESGERVVVEGYMVMASSSGQGTQHLQRRGNE